MKPVTFPQLNFVPSDPFYESIVGKISSWALRVGRYIIIFTEIVVMMSFASRFKLDRDLSDLNSSIAQKTAVINSYTDTEKVMRAIQKKTDTVTKILHQNDGLTAIDTLTAKIPADVKLLRLGYTPSTLEISGLARSSISFTSFLATLQNEPLYKEVTIDQIKTGDSNNPGLAFSIRLSLVAATNITSAPTTSSTASQTPNL